VQAGVMPLAGYRTVVVTVAVAAGVRIASAGKEVERSLAVVAVAEPGSGIEDLRLSRQKENSHCRGLVGHVEYLALGVEGTNVVEDGGRRQEICTQSCPALVVDTDRSVARTRFVDAGRTAVAVDKRTGVREVDHFQVAMIFDRTVFGSVAEGSQLDTEVATTVEGVELAGIEMA
jgi:hypothetical protein